MNFHAELSLHFNRYDNHIHAYIQSKKACMCQLKLLKRNNRFTTITQSRTNISCFVNETGTGSFVTNNGADRKNSLANCVLLHEHSDDSLNNMRQLMCSFNSIVDNCFLPASCKSRDCNFSTVQSNTFLHINPHQIKFGYPEEGGQNSTTFCKKFIWNMTSSAFGNKPHYTLWCDTN